MPLETDLLTIFFFLYSESLVKKHALIYVPRLHRIPISLPVKIERIKTKIIPAKRR